MFHGAGCLSNRISHVKLNLLIFLFSDKLRDLLIMLNKFTNLNGNVRPVSFMLIIIVIPTSLSPCPEI